MRLLRMFTILIAFLAVSAVIQLSSAAPEGERGVVTVEGVPMDRLPDGAMIHRAGIHVGFVNYEAGVPDAQVVLELLDAGGGVLASDTVAVGGDPAGGRRDADGTVGYHFTSLLPHGGGVFTLRLTVDATGSMGSDHKVLTFSVECEEEGDDEGKGEDEGEGESEGQGDSEGVVLAGAAGAVESQPGFAG
jgi:hypothetical protein